LCYIDESGTSSIPGRSEVQVLGEELGIEPEPELWFCSSRSKQGGSQKVRGCSMEHDSGICDRISSDHAQEYLATLLYAGYSPPRRRREQVLVFMFAPSSHRSYPHKMELIFHRALFLYSDCLFL